MVGTQPVELPFPTEGKSLPHLQHSHNPHIISGQRWQIICNTLFYLPRVIFVKINFPTYEKNISTFGGKRFGV